MKFLNHKVKFISRNTHVPGVERKVTGKLTAESFQMNLKENFLVQENHITKVTNRIIPESIEKR